MLALLLALSTLAAPWETDTITDPMDGSETRMFRQHVKVEGSGPPQVLTVSAVCSTENPEPVLMVLAPSGVLFDVDYAPGKGRHTPMRVKVDDEPPRSFDAYVGQRMQVAGIEGGWSLIRTAKAQVLIEVQTYRQGSRILRVNLEGVERGDAHLEPCKGK